MSPLRMIVLAPAALIFSLSAPEHVQSRSPRCDDVVAGVQWMRWMESGQSPLERWCASIGPPYFKPLAVEPAQITRLLIVTWNVHVGGGQLEDFVARHWSDRGHTGLVLLLGETYRAGQDVPLTYPKDLRVPSSIRPSPRTPDITELARRLRMSAAYVPSMRNGPSVKDDREDRGNAILSSEPLSDVIAIELPFGNQRRVALAAIVAPRGSTITPMRVVTTHFDLNNERVAQAEALAGRVSALTGLPIVVGGDFNSLSGLGDGSVRAFSRRMTMEPCGTGRTNRWPLRLDVLAFFIGRLDFIFSTLDASIPRQCETIQDAFRSDHLPVVLTVG